MASTLVQPLSDKDMLNPEVNKRLKAFDDNITANIANNDILVDNENTPEGWHIYANNIDNPHLKYEPEA